MVDGAADAFEGSPGGLKEDSDATVARSWSEIAVQSKDHVCVAELAC